MAGGTAHSPDAKPELREPPQPEVPADDLAGQERRAGERFPASGRGQLQMLGAIATPCRLSDISQGGASILAESPLIPGSRGKLSFEVHCSGRTERVSGLVEVRHCVLKGRAYRAGLQFLKLDPGCEQSLERILAERRQAFSGR